MTTKVPEFDALGPTAWGPFFFHTVFPNPSPTLLSAIKSKDFGNVTKLISRKILKCSLSMTLSDFVSNTC